MKMKAIEYEEDMKLALINYRSRIKSKTIDKHKYTLRILSNKYPSSLLKLLILRLQFSSETCSDTPFKRLEHHRVYRIIHCRVLLN